VSLRLRPEIQQCSNAIRSGDLNSEGRIFKNKHTTMIKTVPLFPSGKLLIPPTPADTELASQFAGHHQQAVLVCFKMQVNSITCICFMVVTPISMAPAVCGTFSSFDMLLFNYPYSQKSPKARGRFLKWAVV